MESSTRFKSSLGKRSIVARIAAVLALAACGVAIYLVVMSFTGDSDEDTGGRERQERTGQERDKGADVARGLRVGQALQRL